MTGVALTHDGVLRQTALPFRGLLGENVPLVGLGMLHLSGPGEREPTSGGAIGLHLGHGNSEGTWPKEAVANTRSTFTNATSVKDLLSRR